MPITSRSSILEYVGRKEDGSVAGKATLAVVILIILGSLFYFFGLPLLQDNNSRGSLESVSVAQSDFKKINKENGNEIFGTAAQLGENKLVDIEKLINDKVEIWVALDGSHYVGKITSPTGKIFYSVDGKEASETKPGQKNKPNDPFNQWEEGTFYIVNDGVTTLK